MKLMTQKMRAKFAKIPWMSTDGKPYDEVKVLAVYFHPIGRYTFYVTEFDGKDTLYGYVKSPSGPDCDEWGYSSLAELEALKVRGLGMERDLFWDPKTTVAEVLNKL